MGRVPCGRLAAVIAAGLVLSPYWMATGCNRSDDKGGTAPSTSAGGTPAAQADAAGPEAGVMKGTATKADGTPLKTFGGSIYGYSLKSGQSQTLSIDGADGKYRVNLGPGQFATRAWTDVEYNGRKYRIDLHPADDQPLLHKYDTTGGVVKNFVWKLDGYRPGADERSDDRFYGHYGGSVMLTSEGNGGEYQSGVLRNYQAKPEPKVPADSTVEVTLTPDGLLIDGSPGKPVILRSKATDVRSYMDRLTRGIPIGRYKATAKETAAGGQTKPLRVVQFETFGKFKPIGPAESITVEFVQSKPPTENVNNVDEINLHAMY